jgi:AcrR family transcriptional regulator
VKAVSNLDDERIPAWQRQSMQRSLQSARARAHARSHRFVAAATQLLQEKGSTDFTVQDVVDRSRMSIRTFYKYFKSKEDLLVALYETVVAQRAVPRLRKRIEKSKDPRLRLRAYIEGLVDLTTKTGQPLAARTLVNYQNRLAESRPADLAAAMKPQFDLLVELIGDIARTSPLRGDLTVESAARLTHYTVLSAVHGRALGSEGAFDITARTIWEFCLSGMGVPVEGAPPALAAAGRGRRGKARNR